MRLIIFILFGILILNPIVELVAQDTLLLKDGKTLIVDINRIDHKRFFYTENDQTKSVLKNKVKEVKSSAGWGVDFTEISLDKEANELVISKRRKDYGNDTLALRKVKNGKYRFVSFGLGGTSISNEFRLIGSIAPTFQFTNGLYVSFRYTGLEAKSKNLPSDYSQGLCFFYCVDPGDKINLLGLGAGKVIYKNSPFVRFTFGGGINIVQHSEAVFTELEGFRFLGSSHSVTYPQKKTGLGVYARGSMELLGTTVIGGGLFAEAQITTKKSFFQMGVYYMIGNVRNRIRPKKKK